MASRDHMIDGRGRSAFTLKKAYTCSFSHTTVYCLSLLPLAFAFGIQIRLIEQQFGQISFLTSRQAKMFAEAWQVETWKFSRSLSLVRDLSQHDICLPLKL